MQTIEIQNGIRIDFEDIIKGIRQLDNQALTTFAGEVNRLVSQRKAKTPAGREAELLQKIKTNIPASLKNRQKQLYARLQKGEITRQEQAELNLLMDKMEEKAAERIGLMGELAALRGISL